MVFDAPGGEEHHEFGAGVGPEVEQVLGGDLVQPRESFGPSHGHDVAIGLIKENSPAHGVALFAQRVAVVPCNVARVGGYGSGSLQQWGRRHCFSYREYGKFPLSILCLLLAWYLPILRASLQWCRCLAGRGGAPPRLKSMVH